MIVIYILLFIICVVCHLVGAFGLTYDDDNGYLFETVSILTAVTLFLLLLINTGHLKI